MALQEKLNDLREQTEELFASCQAHGLLEVARAEPRGTSTRCRRKVRHGFPDRVGRNARAAAGPMVLRHERKAES